MESLPDSSSQIFDEYWKPCQNLAFPVFISPIVWNMCEQTLWIGIFQRATQPARILLTDNIQSGSAVVSTITSKDDQIQGSYKKCNHFSSTISETSAFLIRFPIAQKQ